MEAAQLISSSINLIAFDFGACGKSEGQFLTYGEKEARDIDCVVEYARSRFKIKKVVIWGRSMGASLAMMYASLHPRHVSCLVLDTPFRRLKQVHSP
jgi:pimeloyl-ACP methyl ester carboxylesterase